MPSEKPTIMIRTTEEIKAKFEHISETENRSMSKQAEHLIKKYIEDYEAAHGEIKL